MILFLCDVIIFPHYKSFFWYHPHPFFFHLTLLYWNWFRLQYVIIFSYIVIIMCLLGKFPDFHECPIYPVHGKLQFCQCKQVFFVHFEIWWQFLVILFWNMKSFIPWNMFLMYNQIYARFALSFVIPPLYVLNSVLLRHWYILIKLFNYMLYGE